MLRRASYIARRNTSSITKCWYYSPVHLDSFLQLIRASGTPFLVRVNHGSILTHTPLDHSTRGPYALWLIARVLEEQCDNPMCRHVVHRVISHCGAVVGVGPEVLRNDGVT